MLLYSLILLLLSNAVTLRRDKSTSYNRVTLIILVFTSYILYNSMYISHIDKGIALFGGLFHVSSITDVFHFFVLLLTSIILTLTGFYPRKVWVKDYSSFTKLFFYKFIYYKSKILNNKAEQYKIIEYPLIILFIISGGLFLMSTSDIVSIFLSIELQSYGLYLLCTIYRNSELATSGGLTYFLLGGLSSSFILLATSLLYANSGTTRLESLYVIYNISEYTDLSSGWLSLAYWYKPHYIHFSLLIMSVGFLFKISAAPFHNWSPDVYDAIPTIVTTFVAIVAKVSIFIFFIELVYYTSKSVYLSNFSWTYSLLLSSLLSLIIGTVVGLSQFRIKRLFAYSTISHLGFILLALSINSIESIQSFIFYVMQYSIANLNSFILLISIGYTFYFYLKKKDENLQDKNNSPIQLISQLKGYFYIKPILAISLTITLFSFVGVPPLIGFFAKQMVLTAAIDNGYIFMSLVAILTSVISAVYYLVVVKQIFFDKPEENINVELNQLNLSGYIYNSKDIQKVLTSSNDVNLSSILYNESEGIKEKLDKLSTLNVSNIIPNMNTNEINKNKVNFGLENIVLSSSLTLITSILTLIIIGFMFDPAQIINTSSILSIILFNI